MRIMKPVVLALLRNLSDEDKKFITSELKDVAEVYFLDEINPDDEIVEKAEIAIISTGRGERVRAILKRASNLKYIQSLLAGVDGIPYKDLPSNVIVASNAGANAEEVAEFTVALTLTASKKILQFDRDMREGIWRRDTPKLIRNSTIMILGYGNIGREIAMRFKPFKAKIIAVNRRGEGDKYSDLAIKPDEIEKYIGNVDILISVLPLNKYTRGFINKNILGKMKKDAILVNVGRGPVITEDDLFEHLSNYNEFTAAIDVWWKYPTSRDEKTFQDKPFHLLENIIMTPHIAGTWEGFRRKLLKHALNNIRRYLRGEEIENRVIIDDYI